MLIQPSVQSATPMAAYTGSVSATGVERSVARAPIPPVDESSPDAASQNRLPGSFAAAPAAVAPAVAPAVAHATHSPAGAAETSPADPATATASRDRQQTARQQSQEQADQVVIQQLKARDREVRLHEAAHAAVGGGHAGSPSLQYSRGPDGKSYAVGGEVSISTSPVSGDPQATIEKARVVRAAALAPAQPSSQDRLVAAGALQMETEARAELQQMQRDERAAAESAGEEELAPEDADKAAIDADEAGPVVDEEVIEEPVAPVSPPPLRAVGSDPSDSPAASDRTDATTGSDKPRPNAREQLEKILLGSTGLLELANRQGLVNPQNPFGKSGFLDTFA